MSKEWNQGVIKKKSNQDSLIELELWNPKYDSLTEQNLESYI